MTENLPCLVLPLQSQSLLMPSSAVAEIIPYHEPKTIEDIPDWLIGILNWRGIHIPLTYLEKMESYFIWTGKGENKEEDKRKCYIAVINRIYKIDSQNQNVNQYPFFSILLKNAPKLYHISKSNIEMVTSFKEGSDARFIMEARVQNSNVLIPNLVNLWRVIDTLPSRLQWFRQIIL